MRVPLQAPSPTEILASTKTPKGGKALHRTTLEEDYLSVHVRVCQYVKLKC